MPAQVIDSTAREIPMPDQRDDFAIVSPASPGRDLMSNAFGGNSLDLYSLHPNLNPTLAVFALAPAALGLASGRTFAQQLVYGGLGLFVGGMLYIALVHADVLTLPEQPRALRAGPRRALLASASSVEEVR